MHPVTSERPVLSTAGHIRGQRPDTRQRADLHRRRERSDRFGKTTRRVFGPILEEPEIRDDVVVELVTSILHLGGNGTRRRAGRDQCADFTSHVSNRFETANSRVDFDDRIANRISTFIITSCSNYNRSGLYKWMIWALRE